MLMRPTAHCSCPRGIAPALVLVFALVVTGCGGEKTTFPVYTHGDAPTYDGAGLSDASVPEGSVAETVDSGDGDTGAEPDVPGPDLEKPELKSAFSRGEGLVTARFSEALGAGATDLANYTIKASNNQPLAVLGVQVDPDAPVFVDLAVDAAAINPELSYILTVKNVEDLAGNPIAIGKHQATIARTLYLNIIWHQHQPLYLDPDADQLTGPWVRKHATKDYYDMTAMVGDYPDIHVNVNLTSVLLRQLLDYYVKRFAPFVDVHASTMDVAGFLEAWAAKTDPFVDFTLEPTPSAATITEEQLLLVWKGPWTLLSTSDAIMQHFPDYVALRDANRAEYDHDDFLALKIWFQIAWFDPDFLNGPVTLPDGSVTRVHEWLVRTGDTYSLAVPASEDLARDLLIEGFKVVNNVVPIHQQLFYDADDATGQVEVTTTPMYHPILPLLVSTDLAAAGQPFDPLPNPAFSYPQDAEAQVLRATSFYEEIFGVPPRGIWCGEGSVAEEIIPILVNAGLEWTATDHEVLRRSLGDSAPVYVLYQLDSDGDVGQGASADDAMAIVFRHTDLSDRMGFEYWSWHGQVAAQDFVDDVADYAPKMGGADRLLTVILDGENAWESYNKEHDAKGFLTALYAKLSQAYATGEIVTVTTSEYIHGNPARAVAPHPIVEAPEIEPLWPGSWIGGTFAVWIGEQEENRAWEYLAQARADLDLSGLSRPNPSASAPPQSALLAWTIYQAWDLIYAAEGSDWFWWYGVDQTTPSNDDSPFDRAFRSQLLGMYGHMNAALVLQGKPPLPVPEFAPLVQAKPMSLKGPYGGDTPPPTLDGAFSPSEVEWSPPGGFFFDADSSTAISADDDIGTVYYGYDAGAFYVAVQANDDLLGKTGSDYSLSVVLDHKHIENVELGTFSQDPSNPFTPPGESAPTLDVARRVRVDMSGASPMVRLEAADGAGGWTEVQGHGVQLGGPNPGGSVVELRMPWADLGLVPQADPLNFHVVATEAGTHIDAAPSFKAKRVFDDITDLVYVTFRCDASGEIIPVDALGLQEPPAPHGDGVVFIVGKSDKLGDWIPNKISLSDSGQGSDLIAGDATWSATFGFPHGEVIQYKYTSGTGTFEGQWAGTEEFPYSNRQYVVPEDPAVIQVVIEDVFGDDPPQENSMGKYSQVTEETE
jgi:alpha-amylase/alpha-mannosidase (GH57 family)